MPIVAVLAGPTASGKTALALRWAAARGLEILSADSRQLYRGFAIGTGAPTPEEQRIARHHLTGCVEPRESFSPRRFQAEAEAVIAAHPSTNFLMVGGAGLYIREWLQPAPDRGETPPAAREAAARELEQRGFAAVHAELACLDPEGMRGVDPRDGYRIRKRLEHWRWTGRSYTDSRGLEAPPRPSPVPVFRLDLPRPELHRRIEARVRDMLRRGWADEVRGLLAGLDPETTPAFNSLGYRELARALLAGRDPAAEEQRIVQLTRQYAKRQSTFFRTQIPGARGFDPADLERRLESAGWDLESAFPDPRAAE